jgi:hypothetical protein
MEIFHGHWKEAAGVELGSRCAQIIAGILPSRHNGNVCMFARIDGRIGPSGLFRTALPVTLFPLLARLLLSKNLTPPLMKFAATNAGLSFQKKISLWHEMCLNRRELNYLRKS